MRDASLFYGGLVGGDPVVLSQNAAGSMALPMVC